MINQEVRLSGALVWLKEGTREGKHALLAASLGWMLDSFDVMLYALVLSALMHDLSLSKEQAGILGSITLIAAAAGGIFFGWFADRFGRTKALFGSILIYAIFTAACGFATSLTMLAVFRVLLGIGMGGEWASGASLVAENWSDEHRGKALGLMQSSWAIGYALAAVAVALVMPRFGWRSVFFIGVTPALITLAFRRTLDESEAWKNADKNRRNEQGSTSHGIAALFRNGFAKRTIPLTLMNACTLFAWWAFNLWVPAFLSLPASQNGVGLSTQMMAGFVIVMQAGMWLGYVSFGVLCDRFGRKPCYVTYLLVAAVCLFAYGNLRSSMALFLLGPVLAFFGTGYYTGFATVTAELFPASIRATAQGFTYNLGRIASAVAPFFVGNLARRHGFGVAFGVAAAAFLIAALLWIWIPETKPSGLSRSS